MRKYRFAPGQRAGYLLLVSLGMVAVADAFFFEHTLGWTLGLFALLLLGVMGWRDCRQLKRWPFFWVAGALAGLAVSTFIRAGALAPLLMVGLLATWSLIARHGWTQDARVWAKRALMLFVLGGFTIVQDVIRFGHAKGRVPQGPPRKLNLLGWVLPIGLSFVFILFFAVANPVLDSWFSHLGQWLGRFGLNLSVWIDWISRWLSPERIIFWAFTFCGVWGLLRFRCSLFRNNIVQTVTPKAMDQIPKLRADSGREDRGGASRLYSPRIAVRCLTLFNIVFLVQSLMDVVYLWGGVALPEGMSHAEYAHRGAYPLVFTTLLAAVFVLVTFQPGGRLQQMRIARHLVFLWLAQNLFLTFSAGTRLKLYVNAYDLTLLRVASGIWMVLVFGGVVLILWRIACGHSNNWLIGANALMTFGVLYLCAFLPFGGWIANYNLAHCHEISGEGNALDVDYLYRLGPEALPALDKVRQPAFDLDKAQQAEANRARLSQRLGKQIKDWQGWTWRRASLSWRFQAGGGSGQ